MCNHNLIPIFPPADTLEFPTKEASMDYRFKRLFSHCDYYLFCTKCQEVGYRPYGRGPFKHNGDQRWQNQILNEVNEARKLANLPAITKVKENAIV